MIKVDEMDPVGELDPTFPYRDVAIKRGVDMKEFYDLEGEIGRGKFGTVYKCREKGTNLTLAAKFVGIARRQDRKNVEREVEIMRTLQHPRLIQLYDAFETDNVMCVVLELIEGGELFERVIDDDFILTEKACTVFMRQICEGVAFIHSNNIIHLDLKPENILCLTKTGNRIKIIDFGLARKFEPDKKLQVLFGTPEFVAPEVVNFDQISWATDMWSVGVICYVLLSGLSPFMGETDVETMANVTIARYDFEDDSFDEISAEAKDFISKLLLKDKETRLTAVECLSHPWLRRQIPPPPPTLDTTKDNLRNYVDKYVPYIQAPIIVDKGFIPNKTGLIEQMIENEQKVINSHCIQSIKNEAPIILPTSDNKPGHIILNTEPTLFNSLNQPNKNEKEILSSINSDNKSIITLENIQENNVKNISETSNNQPPQLIFENSCAKKGATSLNIQNIKPVIESKPVLGNENNERKIKNEETSTFGSLKNSTSFTENVLDGHHKFQKANSVINLISNKSPFCLNQENTFHNNDTGNIFAKKRTEIKLDEKTMSKESAIGSFDYSQKLEQNILGNVSEFQEKEMQIKNIGRHNIQMKIKEESNAASTAKMNTSPAIVIPSKSTQTVSDISFITIKKDDPFNRKHDNMFIPEFIRSSTIKKVVNERSVPTAFNEHFAREQPNENDPHIFKQHLRSTPPWFSELSNQSARKNSGDRFDRRSSDFSCFLNSKEDSESINLADEIRKLSARLLQMSNNQPSQNQQFGAYNTNSVPLRTHNDPISCFLENHGILHPRPKFKFSNLNRDVPIGSPPPPSNVAYYLNMATNNEKKDSRSAPESPRSSPEKNLEASSNAKTSKESTQNELFYIKNKSKTVTQEKITSKSIIEQVHINKMNKKLNFPV